MKRTQLYSNYTVETIVVVILILCFEKSSHANVLESLCTSNKNCAECIQSKDHCAWCQNLDLSSGNQTRTKCNSQSYYDSLPNDGNCRSPDLVNPKNKIDLKFDDEISNGSPNSPNSKVIQIRPQHVLLKLRVGQSQDLNVQFAQPKDYPVDLYYLMDLSRSMKDDKDKLTTMAEQLTKKMTEVTSKFQIGFGSFVDKVVMPFVSTVEKKLLRPCGDDEECVPPYSFRNHLKLTDEFSRFAVEVNNSKASGNLDSPEGGFDGIMQVAVCDDIGWRNEARKFIIFATDASFHLAGDGKLGGIIKPNDRKCHLDSSGSYTHAEILDYPSISQINSIVKKNVIHIIFAVTEDQVPIYNSLKGSIEGSAVAHLTNDSSNVVELVTDEYQKITTTIEMKNTASDDITITFYTNCGQSGDISKRSRCTDVPIGTIIDFTAKIEVLKCPTNPSEQNQQFEIYSVGVAQRITVDLDIICNCEECERQEIPKAEKCNKVGTLSCGICKCDGNGTYFGEFCQCNDQSGTRDADEWRCKKENSTDICSKKGHCYCGQCECNRREDSREEITGTFCECDNFSCDRENGLLCSGTEHGSCVCGVCQCEKEWSGTTCECPIDESTCYKPGDNDKCSGKGECQCGQCKCQVGFVETYSGRFCEKCRNCPDECDEISECVLCKVHPTEKPRNCPDICVRYDHIEILEYISDNGTIEEKFCLATDPTDGCRFQFIYDYSANREVFIKAQRTKECPPEAPVPLIIGGGTGVIVLVGVLSIIIWKIFTTIQDRNEYARFEKDSERGKFNAEMNPIYKEATSTYQNPGYAGMGN